MRIKDCSSSVISVRWLLLCLLLLSNNVFGQAAARAGVVVDQTGAAVTNAAVKLFDRRGDLRQTLPVNRNGEFTIPPLPADDYILTVEADNFEPARIELPMQSNNAAAAANSTRLRIQLEIAVLATEISVTANRAEATSVEDAASVITVIERDRLQARPLQTVGNALEGVAGVLVQQSTAAQTSPFLRGLTGYQVLNLIDGVRFNNSAFRSGPNQYLAFIEPSQIRALEVLRGTASAQYGSDALGGTINVLTVAPEFADSFKDITGEFAAFGASADLSAGARARVSSGNRRTAFLIAGSHRKHNDLRAGRGADSHHVFKRFFGLSDQLIKEVYGDRLRETAFAQTGAMGKFLFKPSNSQNVILSYQHAAQRGVRGYKDLWGGLGRLRSDFEPQQLDFFYARYEKTNVGFLDSLGGTFSINSQQDGSTRQNLRAGDPITADKTRVNAFGYAAQATARFGEFFKTIFGAEIYDERVAARRFETNPNLNQTVEKRALYPNGSVYRTNAVFAQNALDFFGNRLRASAGARYTRNRFQVFADRSRDAAGNSLGASNANLDFGNFSYNAALSWQINSFLSLNALTGKGFRAPNLNDLGALGLNDLGFEIPAANVANGFIGTSDGEGAASSGKSVAPLDAETLDNYELGAAVRTNRVYWRAQLFNQELKNPIVRRTLLFPVSDVPRELAGVAVAPIAQNPIQRAQNVASVAATLDPRAVKAFVNDGAARYYGFESLLRYRFARRWTLDADYGFIHGRELNPNRNVRRLPPANGSAALRYLPNRNRLQLDDLEFAVILNQPQNRLSGGDITDERIGAARRRSDIRDFFAGALVRPFINPGGDRVFNTPDDRFAPTNETLLQIQNRVLPIGATVNGVRIADDNSRAPLFTKTKGFESLNARGTFALAENIKLSVGIFNLLDHNYRTHGSGVDALGVNVWINLKYSF